MSGLFLKVVHMSISASWLVLAVLVLRLMLKKAPRWVHVLLWGMVALRLLCPVTPESALSLIPRTEPIPPDVLIDMTQGVESGVTGMEPGLAPEPGYMLPVDLAADSNPMLITAEELATVWICGVLVLLVYSFVSYLLLRRKLRTAVRLRENIYQCEGISAPFVLGIIAPRIYLPYGFCDPHVIAHEQAHIRRRDHWWKPLGFGLLSVHWFNPLMWLGYVLLCRDIELACDEKVVARLGNEQRADYSQALLDCSINRRMISACPLAFGEVGVKERVRSILHYRKPGFWIVVTAVILCAVVAVCFLTDPKPAPEFSMNGHNVRDLDPERIIDRIVDYQDIENSDVYMNAGGFSLTVDSDFNWMNSQTVQYFFYDRQMVRGAQLRIFPDEQEYFLTEADEWPEQDRIFLLRHYLDALKYLPQEAIRELAPADLYLIEFVDGGTPSSYERTIPYSAEGVGETDGWYLHLRILPHHSDGAGYRGSGDEVVHLFYGDKAADGAKVWFDYRQSLEILDWSGEWEYATPEFPGITFRGNAGRITAGEQVLISGMPIWNAYWVDLTGDGYPEICCEVSMGSGIIDDHIVVYDYQNGTEYLLERRMISDYHLRRGADGQLYADKCNYRGGGLLNSGRLLLRDGQLMIEGEPMPDPAIVEITDPSRDGSYAYDAVLEKFYEDERNVYYFSGAYSQYVTVRYADGTSENIVTALHNGRATLADLEKFDILFLAESKQDKLDEAISKAILDHYAADRSDGLLHVESHKLLATEVMSGTPLAGQAQHAELVTVYLLVDHVRYSTYGGVLGAVGGSYVPAAITFRVNSAGEYVLQEYWEPRDGGYYAKDIREKFPGDSAEDALRADAYIEELKAENARKAQAWLEATGSLDQRIGELIGQMEQTDDMDALLRELVGYGEYTLRYCFTEFLREEQTGLRGQRMAMVCTQILAEKGEAYILDYDISQGWEWFAAFRANAQSLAAQHSREDLQKFYPGAWLLLQLTDPALEQKKP